MYTAYAPDALATALKVAGVSSSSTAAWRISAPSSDAFLASISSMTLPEEKPDGCIIDSSARVLNEALLARDVAPYFSDGDPGVGIITSTSLRPTFPQGTQLVLVGRVCGDLGYNRMLYAMGPEVEIFDLPREVPSHVHWLPGMPRIQYENVTRVAIGDGHLWFVRMRAPEPEDDPGHDMWLYNQACRLMAESVSSLRSSRWRSVLIPEIRIKSTFELDWCAGARLKGSGRSQVLRGVFQTMHVEFFTHDLPRAVSPKAQAGLPGPLVYNGPTMMFWTGPEGRIQGIAHFNVRDWFIDT